MSTRNAANDAAKNAVITVIIDLVSQAQNRNRLGMLSHAELGGKADMSLDRAIERIVAAAQEPFEDRFRAQQQEIDDLKQAVELLKPTAAGQS